MLLLGSHPAPQRFIGVWDAEELGEHGLYIQAWTPDPTAPLLGWPDHGDGPAASPCCGDPILTTVGTPAFINERATVEEAVAAVRDHFGHIERCWDDLAVVRAQTHELLMQPEVTRRREDASSRVEQRQLKSQPQQAGLVGRYRRWVGPRQVP